MFDTESQKIFYPYSLDKHFWLIQSGNPARKSDIVTLRVWIVIILIKINYL